MKFLGTIVIGLLTYLCSANPQPQLDLAPGFGDESPAPPSPAHVPAQSPLESYDRPDEGIQVSKPGSAPAEWEPHDDNNPRPPPVNPLPAPIPVPILRPQPQPTTRPASRPQPSRPSPEPVAPRPSTPWERPRPKAPSSVTDPLPPRPTNPWERLEPAPAQPAPRPQPTTWSRPTPTPSRRPSGTTYYPSGSTYYPAPENSLTRTTTIYLPKGQRPGPAAPLTRGNSGAGRSPVVACGNGGGRRSTCPSSEFCYDMAAKKILGARDNGAGICFSADCSNDSDCPARQSCRAGECLLDSMSCDARRTCPDTGNWICVASANDTGRCSYRGR